jgi:hypothetical protein
MLPMVHVPGGIVLAAPAAAAAHQHSPPQQAHSAPVISINGELWLPVPNAVVVPAAIAAQPNSPSAGLLWSLPAGTTMQHGDAGEAAVAAAAARAAWATCRSAPGRTGDTAVRDATVNFCDASANAAVLIPGRDSISADEAPGGLMASSALVASEKQDAAPEPAPGSAGSAGSAGGAEFEFGTVQSCDHGSTSASVSTSTNDTARPAEPNTVSIAQVVSGSLPSEAPAASALAAGGTGFFTPSYSGSPSPWCSSSSSGGSVLPVSISGPASSNGHSSQGTSLLPDLLLASKDAGPAAADPHAASIKQQACG